METHTITALEKHMKMLNQEPPPNEVQRNEQAGGSLYLPISFVQTKLDEIYYGLWSTEITHVQVIANEIVGHGILEVTHPVTGEKIHRAGAGAVMVQQVKGAVLTDVSAKIKNTLVKDYPHLYAEITKSGAKTLGKIFGRDLNRKFVDSYQPASIEHEAADEIRRFLREQLDTNLLPAPMHQYIQANVEIAGYKALVMVHAKVVEEINKRPLQLPETA